MLVFISKLGQDYGFWEEKGLEVNPIFITSFQGHILTAWFINEYIDLDHLPLTIFERFPYCKVL